MKIKTTQEIIEIFQQRLWTKPENKRLINLIKDKRLKMHVSTLKNLDDIGFNHLEILSIDSLINKTIHKLPTSDIDFLNLMQEKHGIVFNLEDKLKNKINIKLNNFVFNFDKNTKSWLGISSLFLSQ